MKYDLDRLASRLQFEGRHAELVKAIRRAYTIGSVSADLTRAANHLELIKKIQIHGGMPSDFTPQEGAALIEALFIAAVIIYARSTVTTPIARDRWWSPDKLNDELRRTHKLAIDLRDKEIAHFGKGLEMGGGPLIAEALYLKPNDESPINFRASSWSTRPEFALDMLKLVRLVQVDAKKKMERSFRDVISQINRACSADRSLKGLIESLPLEDPRLLSDSPTPSVVDGVHITDVWTEVQTRPLNES